MRELTSGLLVPEGPVALPDGRMALVEIARRTVTLVERDDALTGAVEVLYRETGSGHQMRVPNDLVVDRQGGIWFTDLGKRRGRAALPGTGISAAPATIRSLCSTSSACWNVAPCVMAMSTAPTTGGMCLTR